jgi:hypothetical protein
MKIEPELLTHPKYVRLKKAVGPLALEYLLRLWAHCGSNKRGEWWPKGDAHYVELVCEWDRDPGKLFRAFVDAGFIDIISGKADGCTVHDWNKTNSYAVDNWFRNPSGKATKMARPPRPETAAPPAAPPQAPLLNDQDDQGDKSEGSHSPFVEVPSEQEFINAFQTDGIPIGYLKDRFAAFTENNTFFNSRGEMIAWQGKLRRFWVADKHAWKEPEKKSGAPTTSTATTTFASLREAIG